MSASGHLASAVMQGQQHGSVGRWRRRGGISGSGKRLPRGRGGVRRWRQRGIGSSVGRQMGKLAAGMQATLIPPPYAEIGKGKEPLAAPNQRSVRGDNPPLSTGGIFDPWRGGGRLVVHRQRRSYSAGHFLPGVEAPLRHFVATTPTRFCCCHIA